MKKTYNYTWIALIVLTVTSALIANFEMAYAVVFILFLAFLKFIGVAYNFMELNKANVFWKVLLVVFLAGLLTTIVLI